MISDKINDIKEEVIKLQVIANEKGWNMDFESVLIALEGHADTAEKYEGFVEPDGIIDIPGCY